MQVYRPIIPRRRLQRLVLWLLATLSWVAAVMFADRSISARYNRQRGDIALTHLSRWVGNLIMARAAAILRLTRRRQHLRRHTRIQRPSGLRRSLLGAKLRRMLKHKDARTMIAQLITVLRNLDVTPRTSRTTSAIAAASCASCRRLRRVRRSSERGVPAGIFRQLLTHNASRQPPAAPGPAPRGRPRTRSWTAGLQTRTLLMDRPCGSEDPRSKLPKPTS